MASAFAAAGYMIGALGSNVGTGQFDYQRVGPKVMS
jgi:hypothetical protein